MNKSNRLQEQKDRAALRKLGYIQELDRNIDVFSSFSLSFSVISILTGLNTLYGYGLSYGGTASVWTWPLVGFMQIMVVLSLAEIASQYPVAGGVYKWSTILGGRQIGWFCGIISLLGWLGCTAGIEYGLGQFTADFFGISQQDSLMILGIILFFVVSHCLLNLFGIKLVKWFSDVSGVVHIVGALLIGGLLLIFGGSPAEGAAAVPSVDNNLAWLPMLQALLMSAWTLTGFDASSNVSEESINPSRTVPYGMVLSVLVSVVLGTLLLFGLAHATGNVDEVLNSGQPAALYVVKSVLGPIVSKYVTIIMLMAQFACGLVVNTLLVRIVYAISRDGGLPFSRFFKYVSERYGTPVYGIALSGGATLILCIAALGLNYLEGGASLSGQQLVKVLPMITAFSTLGIYLSHGITLWGSLMAPHTERSTSGTFSLGPFSGIVKVISLIWTLFVAIVVTMFNVGAALMFLVVMVMAAVYYRKVARYDFSGEPGSLTEEDLIRIERMRKDREREDYHAD